MPLAQLRPGGGAGGQPGEHAQLDRGQQGLGTPERQAQLQDPHRGDRRAAAGGTPGRRAPGGTLGNLGHQLNTPLGAAGNFRRVSTSPTVS